MTYIISNNIKKKQECALISGATGYLGKKLAIYLNNKKIKVIKSSRKKIKNYLNIIPHNIKTFDNINPKIKKKINYIFYLGTNSNSQQKKINFIKSFTEFKNFFNFAKELQFLKKIVFISSSIIYKSKRNKNKISELDALNINTFYKQEKFLGEVMGLFFHRFHRLPIAIIRFSNLYGLPLKQNTVMYDVFKKIKDKKKIFLDRISNIKDFLHVDDACSALFKILRPSSTSGKIFNIGSGVGTDINFLIRFIAKSLCYDNLFIKNNTKLKKNIYILNINKIKKTINWKPSIYLKKEIINIIKYEKKFL